MNTWKVPWLTLVEVDVDDDGEVGRGAATCHELVLEVIADELLVAWVEAEARRQPVLCNAQ